jgi:hypothetical protein
MHSCPCGGTVATDLLVVLDVPVQAADSGAECALKGLKNMVVKP